ncbi:ABC-type polysaccharide/polyol phosphate export systems, permease component [Corynebacterium mustelae]|uniref:ABC-type polysaccharide/polyol phosphate export systems, permease component n=1 Tax=Corynebacterium mustelae TaxID=571915 RepID=A0A0G3H1R8_9CORY|nr:ABC transporter permease [Corynebacterium mustelae]AKK05057.1 ABC-type polysaccharide/polyol phosphate export systems, permease component [Corynebacterium mustelae]
MRAEGQLKHVLALQIRKQGSYLVVFTAIMIIIALGVVVGFSFLLSSPGGDELLYLATGAPTIVLIMTALVTVPMQNAGARLAGYIDFIKSLPVSRKQFLFADVLIWAAITVPAIVISVMVAHFVFKPGFSVSWTIVPVYLLVVASCFGIGYGYSFVMPAEPAMALSQVIAFTALMFSPINFPLERLPEWLQVVHLVLPLHHMAEVMRASLANATFSAHWGSYVILGVWAVLGFVGAARVLERA